MTANTNGFGSTTTTTSILEKTDDSEQHEVANVNNGNHNNDSNNDDKKKNNESENASDNDDSNNNNNNNESHNLKTFSNSDLDNHSYPFEKSTPSSFQYFDDDDDPQKLPSANFNSAHALTHCPQCDNVCSHQQLLAQEQLLSESAIEFHTSTLSPLSSSKFLDVKDTTISSYTPITPLAPIDPIALAEALESAGFTSAKEAASREELKTRRKDMEAAKMFLAGAAKLSGTSQRSNGEPLDYTTDIPEIFLNPQKVLSGITRTILKKERQDTKSQLVPPLSSPSPPTQNGSQDELQNESQNECENSGTKSQHDEQLDDVPESINQEAYANTETETTPEHNEDSKSGEDINCKEEKNDNDGEDTKSLKLNHTRPPPPPPTLPPHLGTAFLSANTNKDSTKEAHRRAYSNNAPAPNFDYSVPPGLANEFSSTSIATSTTTFVSHSTHSSSSSISSAQSSTLGFPHLSALSPFSKEAKEKETESNTPETIPNHHKYTTENGITILDQVLSLGSTNSSGASSQQASPGAMTSHSLSSPNQASLLEQRYLANPQPPKYTNFPDEDDPDALNNRPSHVTLNHLATSCLKNSILAAACTSRYKEKYITQILYTPM